jgi:hypothetical protein
VSEDFLSSAIIAFSKEKLDVLEKVRELLLWIATPEGIVSAGEHFESYKKQYFTMPNTSLQRFQNSLPKYPNYLPFYTFTT